jgi:hypothetical protein
MTSTGSRDAERVWPNPTGSVMAGNHRSHWATSPAAYKVREAGSGGRYTGRSSRTRSLSTVSDRVQPIRSAITVAGIVGHAWSSSRMRGSTASTIDPPPTRRSYRGGPSAASARFTVFFETPITRATALIGIPSARYSRRISAQSSTLNTSLPPQLDSSQGPRGVNFQASSGGQFSHAADNRPSILLIQQVRSRPAISNLTGCWLKLYTHRAQTIAI